MLQRALAISLFFFPPAHVYDCSFSRTNFQEPEPTIYLAESPLLKIPEKLVSRATLQIIPGRVRDRRMWAKVIHNPGHNPAEKRVPDIEISRGLRVDCKKTLALQFEARRSWTFIIVFCGETHGVPSCRPIAICADTTELAFPSPLNHRASLSRLRTHLYRASVRTWYRTYILYIYIDTHTCTYGVSDQLYFLWLVVNSEGIFSDRRLD